MMKWSKLEVLEMLWDWQLSKISVEAVKKKDKKVIQYTKDCLAMPKDLRKELLTQFLAQCKLKHQIAFFQWRDMYVDTSITEQLTEALESKINYMKRVNPKLI